MGVQVMHPPDSDPDTPPELAAAPPVRPLLTVRKPFHLGSQENVNLHNLRHTNCFICTGWRQVHRFCDSGSAVKQQSSEPR